MRSGVVLMLAALGYLPVAAQNASTQRGQHARQAASYEEFDAYLAVMRAPDAASQLLEAKRFMQAYPNSELLVYVREYEMYAHRELNQIPEAISAAESALAETPKNTKALLALAQLLAEQADFPPQSLERVSALASRCREELARVKVPRSVSLSGWEETRAMMESEAHAAHGLAAARVGKLGIATREMEAAVARNPHPDGAQHYYLGRFYAEANRAGEARAMLSRAKELGPESVRRSAVEAMAKLH